MRLKLRSITLLVLTIGCPATQAAFAQDYPAKPVQIIEPFGAGGGPDLLARALAPKLSGKAPGQTPRLTDDHRAALARIVEDGPIPAGSWRRALATCRSLPVDVRGAPGGSFD